MAFEGFILFFFGKAFLTSRKIFGVKKFSKDSVKFFTLAVFYTFSAERDDLLRFFATFFSLRI